MEHYAKYGFNDFVIALGYKGSVIKNFFKKNNFNWNINLIETGLKTMTGGRVKKIQNYIKEKTFMLTYGDGLSDINIKDLIKFHKSHGRLMTMTSSQPDGRFGAISLEGDRVKQFIEKPKGDNSWINAGYFVCDKKVFDYIEDRENEILEKTPLENLAFNKQLYTYKHKGFWMPMDTLRDKIKLEEMWNNKKAPWM